MSVICGSRGSALGRVKRRYSGERRTLVLAAGLVVLSVLAIAWLRADRALAAPPWSAPATVFEDADPARSALAYSGDGRALVAQSRGSGFAEEEALVTLATRTPTGRYRRFRDVSGEAPSVVAYGETRAVVLRFLVDPRRLSTGTHVARVGVSYGRTSGDIDPVKILDEYRVGDGDDLPLMAASRDGRIAVAYLERRPARSPILWLAVREPGQRFERRQVDQGDIEDLTLDVGANGEIVVAWREDDHIRARVQRSGHSLGRIEELGPAAPTATLDASVADNGEIAVAWSAVHFVNDGRGISVPQSPVVVRAAIRPSGPRHFEPAQTLYDSGERRDLLTDIAIDSSATGATVAWTATQLDGSGARRAQIQTASSDSTRRFGPPQPIVADATVNDIMVRSEGVATVVWTPLLPDPQRGLVRGDGLFASVRAADSAAFGGLETVTDEPASLARLALNPLDGRATVLWHGPSDGSPSLRASTRN